MSTEAALFPQYFAGISASMGSFALGAVIGWCSPVELAIKGGELGFKVSDTEFAWVGCLMTLGAAFVCIPIGIVMNIVGRKWTMLGLVPLFVVGWVLILTASSVTMLYGARFLLGMSGGAFSVITPIYTTEIAQTKIRGIMGSLFQMLFTVGVLYGFVVGSLVSVVMASVLCGIVPIVMGCLVLMLPESPAFFIKKGRVEQAEKSMRWLRGKNYDISGEMAQLVANDKYAHEPKVSLWKTLKKKNNLNAFCLSISLMLIQQLSGIDAIIFYCPALFKNAYPDFSETISTVIVGLMMMITTFISLFLIDRIGRRILLVISACFMSVSTLGVGYFYIIKDSDPEAAKPLAMLPVICACIFVITYSIGFGAIPWLMIGEIFSEDIKSVAASIAVTINWGTAFLVTNLYPLLNVNIGVGPIFCLFALKSAIAVLFVIFFLPETKNKTFLEIQMMLEK